MTRNVYSAAVFAGGRRLCTHILPGQGRPHQPFLASENQRHWATRRWRRIPLLSLVLTQYRSVTDRRTEGRICRSIYSACKVSFAARCSKPIRFRSIVNSLSCKYRWTCLLLSSYAGRPCTCQCSRDYTDCLDLKTQPPHAYDKMKKWRH